LPQQGIQKIPVQLTRRKAMHRKFILGFCAALTAMNFGLAHADVSSSAHEAKDATVNAAKKTGDVASDAASAAVSTAKKVGHKTADVAVGVYDKTKKVSKDAVGAVAGKTREVAGKVEDSVSK
jgi:hypothetical protein